MKIKTGKSTNMCSIEDTQEFFLIIQKVNFITKY